MKKTGNFYGEIYKYTLKATEKSIANGDAGKCYIGQTGNSKKRQGDWDSQDPRYAGPKINEKRRIYPPEDWVREVLVSRTYMKKSTRNKKLDELETEMIKRFDAVENGFNTSYGRGMKGLHHTEESKRKMSLAKMGHKVDAATRAKISKSLKKRWKQKRKSCINSHIKGEQLV